MKAKINTQQAVEHLATVMPEQMMLFTKMQLKAVSSKAHGRRYSDSELMESLALFYQGARAYRHLRPRLGLPSPRLLRQRMERIQLLPGFHEMILGFLKEKLRGALASDRRVVISFDEMQLRAKLTYLRGEDRVEGFEDFGSFGRTGRFADHALVFMVRGISSRWKQPIGYFHSAGTTPASVLEQLLVACIRKARQANLEVISTVCDMGKANQELYKKRLGVTEENPVFSVDGVPVVAMYDPPHLIKCIRNCLLRHDVHVDDSVMSWEHVKELYQMDRDRPVSVAPKLKKDHVFPGPFKKMKVKLATQALSRTVSAGLHLYAAVGEYLGNICLHER